MRRANTLSQVVVDEAVAALVAIGFDPAAAKPEALRQLEKRFKREMRARAAAGEVSRPVRRREKLEAYSVKYDGVLLEVAQAFDAQAATTHAPGGSQSKGRKRAPLKTPPGVHLRQPAYET